MTRFQWGEWAEVVLRDLLDIKPGEELLVLADTWTDPMIADACLQAGINAQANAQLLVIARRDESDRRELSRSTAGAIAGADAVLGLCETSFTRKPSTLQALEKGTRITSAVPRGDEAWTLEGVLAVDFPKMLRLGERISALWQQTELCRVTSIHGTDVSFSLKGRPVDIGEGQSIKPGEVDFFPGGTPSIAPIEHTINGTVVVDSATTLSPVSEPFIFRLENGVITSIEGGADADAWRASLESAGEPKAFHLCHFNVGINPRARMGVSLGQDEMVIGVVTFGFGHQDGILEGTVGQDVIMHSDVTLQSPTIEVDGLIMCENNKFHPDLLG